MNRLEQFDQLPVLLRGTKAWQVCSRDRTGGNDDGYNSTYSYLYLDSNGEYVLFDESVPGCVYRFWITYTSALKMDTTYLRFYFNGESVPRLSVTVGDYFRGIVDPFLHPLIGFRSHSSGGAYSYYPFPYSAGLKITMTAMPQPFYYNITYHRFDSGSGVDTWSSHYDVSGAVEMLENSAIDPKPTHLNQQVEGEASLADGTTALIYTHSGAGVIQSLKFDFGSLPLSQLSDMHIFMNWDGGDAEVSAPLDEFFAYKAGGIDVRALPVGMSSNGTSYCYFPMPFWNSAEISIQNNTGLPVSNIVYEVQVSSNSFEQAETGCFHVDRMTDTFSGDGRDYCFLDIEGRGHFVGMSIYMDGAGTGESYLEGDERIYVDDSLTPAIYGTGAEDYFNCGWYFYNGEVSLPYHGSTYQKDGNTLAYRFHLTDVIPFEKSIKAGIEHGVNNASAGTYVSVAYYYLAQGQKSGMALVADLNLRDSWSESLYNYDLSGASDVSGSWYYEGDDDTILIPDTGYTFGGEISEFTVPLLTNNSGLFLRRRTDQRLPGQQSSVLIDGVYAGTWYEPDANFHSSNKRWLDAEFMIPSELVDNKDSVKISIIPEASSAPWNEYHYWAYCIKPYAMLIDTDGDLIPDDWELDRGASLDLMDGSTDPDQDGNTDYAEYVSGTNPDDSNSCLRLGNDLTFESKVGHLYHLEECSNLLSNDWKMVLENIPGNGGLMQLPPEAVNASGSTTFRRLRVERQ